MQAKQIVARVEELVRPLCEQAGVSLWDVEFEKEGGQYMLTVTVDHPEGVNIDQCEKVSRALDPMLDAKEFDDMPSYTFPRRDLPAASSAPSISRPSWDRRSRSVCTRR